MIICMCAVLLSLPLCILGVDRTRDVLKSRVRVWTDIVFPALHSVTISLRRFKRTLRRLGLRRCALQDRALLLGTLRVIEVKVVS